MRSARLLMCFVMDMRDQNQRGGQVIKRIANETKKAVWTFAAVLSMTAFGSALQASIPVTPNPKVPEFAKATVHWVIVSIPDRKLALLQNGRVVRIYRVAVGKASTPSPTGAFKIANRVTNPTYYHKGQVIAAGKGNPVGTRWMGLSARGYGIHGTNQPNSIGKPASTGCIRMGQRDLEELFEQVDVGDTVDIRGERDEQVAQIFAGSSEPETIAEVRGAGRSEAGAGQ
jgi:lipoprotein-anchoring transpeptidase ErfK/SrfK